MPGKKNCWESKQCGREAGGSRVKELGVCPSSTEKRLEGTNGGKNGGRACWAIAGTFCGGAVQGSFASKLKNCLQCDFYKGVLKEEGKDYQNSSHVLKKLENDPGKDNQNPQPSVKKHIQ